MTMIAYVGPDLPHDVLTATRRCVGPMTWNIDRAMPLADRWLESKFPAWARSILQDWAEGVLDGLEAVVFSRADDAAQRLYYYLCELRRQGVVGGPEPLIFDAATIPRASSGARLAAAVRGLADRLGVDAAALEQGIVETNTRRTGDAATGDARRCCLIAGTPPADRRLHAMIEHAGWQASGDTLGQTWAGAGAAVDEGSDDPFAAVAAQMHRGVQSSRGFRDMAAALMEGVRSHRADAVLLWLAEEDEARLWHLPAQRDALAAAGVPALFLTRRDWRANDGEAESIDLFLKGIGA